jgi:DNA (cytosine-5)-methyltransferase 1
MKRLRHLELFAGIGGFRKAIDLFGKDYGFRTSCVGFSEIDPWARKTYDSNFNTAGEVEIGDISDFVSSKTRIRSLPDFELMTAGFPCQPFSLMGEKKGFEDERGNVFLSIIKLLESLKSRRPKYLLFENVKNLATHDRGRTLNTILHLMTEAGYMPQFTFLNTSEYGLAQTRNRIFIFGYRNDLTVKTNLRFSNEAIKAYFDGIFDRSSLLKQRDILDVLHRRVPDNFYLSDRIKPTILADGAKNFRSKSEINQLIARPLTATMVKLHRACQDNYYSDGFLRSRNPYSYVKRKFSKAELASQRIRKLTPDEALALQGFDVDFFINAVNAGVSSHQIYRQAGNAVSINPVYGILAYLFSAIKLPL